MDAAASKVPYVKCTWQASGGRCLPVAIRQQHKMSSAYRRSWLPHNLTLGCLHGIHAARLTADYKLPSVTVHLSCWRSNRIQTRRL